MLLSHNFALLEGEIHPLNRAEFAEVFSQAFADKAGIGATYIENPHWVVEVRYAKVRYTAKSAGELCAETLANYRKDSKAAGFTVMALGGLKTTPPTGGPPSLQQGEWGVDVVETKQPDEFLDEINWDKLTAAKPADSVFRIDQSI
ncbi:MAG: DUF2656 domain-containing protein [Leptolyngbya foveolarum]|uniref:DUF2656 domain-containing protein n=1 Tax=Leptolyngbya foveolarum TaxID=47253 RepID=A0A2W4UKJ8_9CYAN|nr:MAG: DUF2656 domain-containing protein [Leptolyngbya foveolarum]